MEQNDKKQHNGLLKVTVIAYLLCIAVSMVMVVCKYVGLLDEEISYITCLAPVWLPACIFVALLTVVFFAFAIVGWKRW